MLCERTREWVALRLDGELSEFETAIMRAHLERCDECSAFADDVAAIARALRTTPLQVPSTPVVLEPRRRVPMPLRRVQLGAAAALVLVAAGVGSLYGAFNGSRQPSAPVQLVHAPMGVADDAALLRQLRVAELRPTGPLPLGATKPPLEISV